MPAGGCHSPGWALVLLAVVLLWCFSLACGFRVSFLRFPWRGRRPQDWFFPEVSPLLDVLGLWFTASEAKSRRASWLYAWRSLPGRQNWGASSCTSSANHGIPGRRQVPCIVTCRAVDSVRDGCLVATRDCHETDFLDALHERWSQQNDTAFELVYFDLGRMRSYLSSNTFELNFLRRCTWHRPPTHGPQSATAAQTSPHPDRESIRWGFAAYHHSHRPRSISRTEKPRR